MADKKIEIMQNDIKLLKGEIKKSLGSVRDYLLNMELPSSEISNILSALSSDGEKITMKGTFEAPPERQPAVPQESPSAPSSSSNDALGNQEEVMEMDDGDPDSSAPRSSMQENRDPEDSFTDEYSEEPSSMDDFNNPPPRFMPESQYPGAGPRDPGNGGYPRDRREPVDYPDYDDDIPGLYDRDDGPRNRMENTPFDRLEPSPEDAIPRVNMLANLINWVSRAKREIGSEQLPVFLEVYGISGHLSPELKDIILHLAEITGEKSAAGTDAGVWSESMLSLHGILTGGEAPMHPVLPSWCAGPDAENYIDEEEIVEPDEEVEPETPVKLKLVFPTANGKEREFCIDLSPESETRTAEPVIKSKRAGR